MGKERGIIPFSPDPKGGRGLIPAKDLEAQRKAFEAPAREATFSEIVAYYAPADRALGSNPARGALIPAILAKLPAVVGKYDTLEAARRKGGWDKRRLEAESSISEALSFKEGLERFKLAAAKHDFGAKIREQLGKSADPCDETTMLAAANLTAEEVTWLSVLGQIPTSVFEDNLLHTSTIVDHYYDGVEWAFDTLRDPMHESPRDSYEALGLTGVRSDAQFTPFETRFKALMVAYYYLVIGDGDVFDRVWEDVGWAAIQSGDGKLLRALAAKEGRALDDAFASEARRRVNEFLAGVVVVHAAKARALAPKEIVKLVGLLEAVPECLFGRAQVGFIPCGKGVMFVDAGLAELEYAPLDPYVGHLAETEIQRSAGSVDRTNRIWHFIFDRVRGAVERRNIDEGNFTLLDEIAADLFLKHGIKVDLGVKKRLRGDPEFGKVQEGWFSSRDHKYSSKIGYFSLCVIAGVLEKVPPPLLKRIKTIKRDDFALNMEQVETGSTKWGEFREDTGALTIAHPWIKEMEEVDDAHFEHCMAHEVGHGVYLTDPRIAKAWKRLSRAKWKFPIPMREREFLTAYASTSVKEDFAETFAAYMCFGKEFRGRAADRPVLGAKYEYMKRLFLGKEFEQAHEFVLADICGPILFDFKLQQKILEETGEDVMKAALNRRAARTEKAARAELAGPKIESVERKGQEPMPGAYVVEAEPIITGVLRTRLGKAFRFVSVEEVEYHIIRSRRRDVAAAYLLNRLSCTLEEAQAHVDAVVVGLNNYVEQMRLVNEALGQDQLDPEIDDDDDE